MLALGTRSSAWRKVLAVNSIASFTAGGLTGRAGPPSGVGVFNENPGAAAGSVVTSALLFKLFGVGTDTQTFKFRLWGWAPVIGFDKTVADGPVAWWEPALLAELLLTLTDKAGVAGGAIIDTDYEADTIAVTYGNEDVDVSFLSNNANVRGCYARIDLQGFPMWQAEFDKGTATSANALVRRV